MRTWFWTLLLIVAAVVLAVVLQAYPGNVLLLVGSYRIEVSLMLAVLLLVALFVCCYVGLRMLVWLSALPKRMRAWQVRRAQARDHAWLERGWISLLEGRYTQAEKTLTKLLRQTKARPRRVLAALSAARAAHGLGEFERCDQMLDRARKEAGRDADLIEAVAMVAADLLLEQGQPQQALETLAPLRRDDGGVRHLHTQRLLLRIERALGHHEQVLLCGRALLRRGVSDRAQILQILEVAGAARLRGAMADGSWRTVWKAFKAEERLLPDIALAGAAAFEAEGEINDAARILEVALAARFDVRLLAAYSRSDRSQVPRRLEHVESWLQQRPTDPDVLTALGLLCLTGQLWGQAERYLLRSVEHRPEPRAHALLASLYDRLDRQDEAVQHWRLATAMNIALPVLDRDFVLPAAETHADPSRSPLHGDMNLDEYFDSAPIPVAGLDEVGQVDTTKNTVTHLADVRSSTPEDSQRKPASDRDSNEDKH